MEEHFGEISAMYEKTQQENHELNDKITVKEGEYEKESREIKKTFLEVQESS